MLGHRGPWCTFSGRHAGATARLGVVGRCSAHRLPSSSCPPPPSAARALLRALAPAPHLGLNNRPHAATSTLNPEPQSPELPSAPQIQIHHRGVYHFKGLSEPIALMQINSAALAGRRFPDTVPSKKAKQLAEPLGLKCTVVLPAQLLHAPTTNQA